MHIRAKCVFRHVAKRHYYADAESRIVRTQDARVATDTRSGWKYLWREIRDDYWFSTRSQLLHSSTAYHTIETRPITDMHFYVRILKLIVDNMLPQRKEYYARRKRRTPDVKHLANIPHRQEHISSSSFLYNIY